jgi:citrate synthase
LKNICELVEKNSKLETEKYVNTNVKTGLRNKDGSGVVVGFTNICNVHGYVISEGEKEPSEGKLIYRGIDIKDIVRNVKSEERYGFEETVYLLLTGELPNKAELSEFTDMLSDSRALPENFFKDMILAAPSNNVMNKLSRSTLALYSYDENAENNSLEHEIMTAISLIAKMPRIMVDSYQVKRSYYDGQSMILHPLRKEETTAQTILSLLRNDREYTEEEAHLLDTLLMLHAEHGGGNNSTFVTRVLTSTITDPYSAYAAAIGSLKGKRHGGANINTVLMLENFKTEAENWQTESGVAEYIEKLIRKQAGDKTGLVYGMGHAVYTVSDPRAEILKKKAEKMAVGTEFEKEYTLLERIERLTPNIMSKVKNIPVSVCANVDLYSGLVYKMLNIPEEIITPLFACARIAGWSAHRIEELLTVNKIIRPAYKAIAEKREYVPLSERD